MWNPLHVKTVKNIGLFTTIHDYWQLFMTIHTIRTIQTIFYLLLFSIRHSGFPDTLTRGHCTYRCKQRYKSDKNLNKLEH